MEVSSGKSRQEIESYLKEHAGEFTIDPVIQDGWYMSKTVESIEEIR